MTAPPGSGDAPVPWLLREARDVYRDAIRRTLAGIGCDDLPRNGAVVVASLHRGTAEAPFNAQADVVASLGLSKQAASQLIDTLVLREYLERRVDPQDRRRSEVRLTERGQAAATAVEHAVDTTDGALARLIGADQFSVLRSALAAFRQLREQPTP